MSRNGSPADPAGAPAATAALAQVEAFLEQTLATAPDLRPVPDVRGRGRPPLLPEAVLWAGLLVWVLRGGSHLSGLWRLLALHGFWSTPRLPLSEQAVTDRLLRGGLTPLHTLFTHLTTALRDRPRSDALATLAPFATGVYALDSTTLDQVARSLPGQAGTPRRLPGKLAVRFDLRRQLFDRVLHVASPVQNDKVTAPALVDDLPAGALVLADLGYFSFPWFDALTDRALWWVSRLRRRTSYTVDHVFYHQGTTRDALVWLGAYQADRARHLVRLIEFQVGTTTYTYLTNVRDPQVLSLHEVAGLYQRRWDIERAFALVKVELGLGLVWSTHDVLILQQVWAALTLAQVLQTLRQEVAVAAQVDPVDVSLHLLVQHLPRLVADRADVLAVLVAVGRRVGIIRPSSRTANAAPVIPFDHYTPAPADLPTTRRHRYAGKA